MTDAEFRAASHARFVWWRKDMARRIRVFTAALRKAFPKGLAHTGLYRRSEFFHWFPAP